MDSFNKIISFVLGLVVVLVFVAVITGRLNLKNKIISTTKSDITSTPAQKNNNGFFGFFKSASPTPTPTQKTISTVVIEKGGSGNNIYNVATPKSIPSTGLPTIFLPMLISGLIGGNFLRKSGKK